MLIFGTFEQSLKTEEALAVIEEDGIQRDNIRVTLMDSAPDGFAESTRKYGRNNKAIEVGMAFGTAASIFGMSYGFVLKWGPIFWALITAFIGFAIGFGIVFLVSKGKHARRFPDRIPEIIIVVQCTEDRADDIIKIMWKYEALTVGKS